MKLTKKTMAIAALATVVFLTIPFVLGSLGILWGRTYRVPFTVNAPLNQTLTFEAFAASSWSDYQTQTDSEFFNLGGSILISLTEVFPADLDLVINFNSSVSGLVLKASGRYVTLYRADNQEVINRGALPYELPVDGSAFTLRPGDMYWRDPYPSGSIGEAYEISFRLVTDGIPPGSYTCDISIGLGVI